MADAASAMPNERHRVWIELSCGPRLPVTSALGWHYRVWWDKENDWSGWSDSLDDALSSIRRLAGRVSDPRVASKLKRSYD